MERSLPQRHFSGTLCCQVACRLNQVMIRRPAASWVHGVETTGQMIRLAAASAKVDGAVITAAASVGHPRLPSKTSEAFRLFPDVEQRSGSGTLERETRQCVRKVTGKHQPVRTHDEMTTAPPVHTGSWRASIIIWRHEEDFHPAFESCPRCMGDTPRLVELLAGRHQGLP